MPASFDKVKKHTLCEKADGCTGFWQSGVRYEKSINAWIPIVRVAYSKTGRYNPATIRAKLKAEMNEEADKGFFLLRDARKLMEVQFEMDRR